MIRGFNLRGAIAVNVIAMIGIGPLITIPLVVARLHGVFALVGWIAGAAIATCDGLVWAELGARYPASGGTYAFLRDSFGDAGAGRMLAFLFIWQTVFSLPVVLATGYIGFAQYAGWFVPALASDAHLQGLVAAGLAIVTLAALYRRVESTARVGALLAVIAIGTLLAIIAAGLPHLNAHVFASPPHEPLVAALLAGLGPALIITTYDYAGYGTACMVGDEVVDPPRTLPRAVLAAVAIVATLYVLLQISVTSVVPWEQLVPASRGASAPPEAAYVGSAVVARTWGGPAAGAVTLAVLVTAFASTYATLLAAARIPYAGARGGLFLAPFARLHPTGRFPHVSLLVMGLVAVPFCFLSLGDAINWLTTAGVLIQSIAQIGALFALRARGERSAYRMWLYPIPAIVALAAWTWVFLAAGAIAIGYGVSTLAAGAVVYLVIAKRETGWPFA